MPNRTLSSAPTRQPVSSFPWMGALLAVWATACSQGGETASVQTGEGLGLNPATGDSFLFEPSGHQGGAASVVNIANVFWGRLVDIHDQVVDDNGTPADTSDDQITETLQFTDFVIGQDIVSDGLNFELRRDPITERETLVILHPADSDLFLAGLERVEANLQPLLVKGLGANVAPPFSAVPRNAAVVVVFSDLIDPATVDDTSVIVRTGNPPTAFFESRVFCDPNHGALAGGAFFPTRVVIDTTVSELDAQQNALNTNTLGLPPAPVSTQGNVVVSVPTLANAVVGQTKIVRNLSGHAIATGGNGPTDQSSLTGEIVRVFRSGMSADPANGFLPDDIDPSIIGLQGVTLTAVGPPQGPNLNEFVVSARFGTPACAMNLAVGDVFRTTSVFARVVQPGTLAGADLSNVRVRIISGIPTALTTGPGDVLAPFEPTGDNPACFIRFQPPAGQAPNIDVQPHARPVVLFSEPMDPDSLLAFDTFTLRPQDTSGLSPIEQRISAEITPSIDLREYRLTPTVDLNHTVGAAETYVLALAEGITDLAGNRVADPLGTTTFSLDPNAAGVDSGNIVLSFGSTDEDGDGVPEVTGNFLFDLSDPNGRIRPRDVQRFSAVVDSNRPMNAPMQLVGAPIITPHVPLGSRMQTVWRIYEFGFGLLDPTTWDIDVEGLNWTPFGGSVQLDRFDSFEILLTHSGFLPDEETNGANLPSYPNSGLLPTFDSNALDLGEAPPLVVHPGADGYVIQPLDLFPSATGTPNVPWPMNRNRPVSEFETYTWRDTSIQALGAPNGVGADAMRYQTVTGDGSNNGVFAANEVPTLGLPLLMEFRCQPDSASFGQNGVQLAIALNSSPRPFFRAFSSGGFDTAGQPQTINPNVVTQATGGYGAAGNQTAATDNSVQFGQADFVVRVSRMHTAWFDTQAVSGATWGEPVIEPLRQPLGTSVQLAFRGAGSVGGQFGNANRIGAYGNSDASAVDAPLVVTPQFLNADPTWKDSLSELDGAQFVQIRVTFVSNIESLLGPTLSALGLSFTR